MAIAEREAFQKAIITLDGEHRDSLVLTGGDLSITPYNKSQQTTLLGITEISERQIKSSLPRSTASIKNGIIFGVPTCDHEDEILEALAGQDVTHGRRLPMRDRPDVNRNGVILTS